MGRHCGLLEVVAGLCLWALSPTLGGAEPRDLLVSSRFSNNVILYDGSGGAPAVFAEGGGLVNAIGMDFGPDGELYVASGDLPLVNRYSAETGEFLSSFVFDNAETAPDETGGLASPRGLTFGPDGNLYVSGGTSDRVHVYDGTTGAFLRVLQPLVILDGPIGLAFGPDGDLYVASALTDRVLRYDGKTGDFRDTFVAAGAGGLDNPTGLAFGADGHLYVGSAVTNRVLRYDGATGDFLDIFASGGGLMTPIGITFGPDGNLYVASFQNDRVLRFDGSSGRFIDVFAMGGGLDGTHFMLFLPVHTIRGDVDGDGTLHLLRDAVYLLNWGAGVGPVPPCGDSADVDGNGRVEHLSDALFLLAAGFLPGSPRPPAPFPTCGDLAEIVGCEKPGCP